MALSSTETRDLCTEKEWALVQASFPGEIEKLSSTELKKHATNARKLADKWQDLSRTQARKESRKTGSPKLDTRTHDKHALFQATLEAFESRLNSDAIKPTSPSVKLKPTSEDRTAEARATRQSTRKDLRSTKKAIQTSIAAKKTTKKVAKGTQAKTSPPTSTRKKTTSKKSGPGSKKAAATKQTLVKTAAARKAKRATASGNTRVQPPAPTKTATKKSVSNTTGAKQAALAGKIKANRAAISSRTNKIAGHVSARGKRSQAKRDSKG